MVDRTGQHLGNYRLIQLLGKGGFAEVYLGEHRYLKTYAALKILFTSLDEVNAEHFLAEAQTLGRLKHPHIVRVLEYFVEQATPVLVMDYAPGGTLRHLHSYGSRLALQTVIGYINQVSSALQYAHDHNIIHRDVKPENILLDVEEHLLLSDFGISLFVPSPELLSTQLPAGTMPYSSPEQLRGKPSFASDQYALGIVAYEWLCGTRPFEGNRWEIVHQHLYVAPIPPRQKHPDFPIEVERVLMRALAKDPARRFASVQEFANALEHAGQLSGLVLDGDTQPLQRVKPVSSEKVAKDLLVHLKTTSKVFLCAAPADVDFANRLKIDLNMRGVYFSNVALDTSVDTMDDEKGIQQVVRVADLVLVVLSPSTRSSRLIKEQMRIANMYERRLIFVWSEGDEAVQLLPVPDVWGKASVIKIVDARAAQYEHALQKIIASIADNSSHSGAADLAILDTLQGEPRNPYKGLHAFSGADSRDFFGRDTLIQELAETLQRSLDFKNPSSPGARLLTVIGPSGSGKSSVAMAGLLPALQQGALPNSENWIYLSPVVPGTQPLEELALVFAKHLPASSPHSILRDLEDDSSRGLHRLGKLLTKQPEQKVVLLVDQFEEVFAQAVEEQSRQRFIDLLVSAVSEPLGPIVLILTLRADFYDRPMRYMHLGQLIEAYHKSVLPMGLRDLRAVIERPAALPDVQLTFEGNLVGDLLFESYKQVGALPLLEFTLDQLFQEREGLHLTERAYRNIGGVKGALAKHAEATYNALPTEQHRWLARALFLRLIDPGISEQDTTRRRAALTELSLPDAQQTELMRTVAEAFIAARLLTTSEVAGSTTIEVSHEALIREWSRLSNWLQEARQDIILQQAISADAADWAKRGSPVDRLYRGSRLTEAQQWAIRNIPSKEEEGFLAASAVESELQQAQEQKRQVHEQKLRRQTVNRQRGLIAVLSVLLLVSVVFAYVFQSQSVLLQDQNRNISSRALAAQANYALAQGQVDKALLLSVKANQTTNNFDARDSLLNALEYSPHQLTMLHETSALVNQVTFRRDGQALIAAASVNGEEEVTFWDMQTRRGHTVYLDFHGRANTIQIWVLSPDEHMVAGANDDGLWLWDTKTGAQLAQIKTTNPEPPLGLSSNTSIAFSPDGTLLAWSRCAQYDPVTTNCVQSKILMWNVIARTTANLLQVSGPAFVTQLAFSPNGKTLVSSTQTSGSVNTISGGLQLWDVTSGTQLVQSFANYSGGIADFALSLDGKTLAASDGNANIYLWDMQSQKQLEPPISVKGAHALAFSSDGKRLAAGDIDNTGHIWNLLASPPTDIPLLGHQKSITCLSFSPDGQMLASGDGDGSILLWNMVTDSFLKHEISYADQQSSAIFSPDGKMIVAGDTVGKITFNDATTGLPRGVLDATASPDTQVAGGGHLSVVSLALSPDKRILAAGRYDGMIFLWDAATKKPISHFHGEKQLINIAFNADGHILAVSYNNGSILLWDSIKGRVLHQLRAPIQNGNSASSLAFSPDGKLLASGDNNTVVLWDMATDKLISPTLTGHPASITNVAFSLDGKMLASIDSSGNILLWDVATKKPLQTTPLANTDTSNPLDGLSQTGLVFSPDGSLLAAGGRQSVTIWDVKSHERFTHAFHPRGSVVPAQIRGVTFSPDGQHLLVLSDTYMANFIATLWNINKGLWQTYACSIVNRNFTLDEWKQFLGEDPYQKVCLASPIDRSVTQDELTQAHIEVQAGNRSDAQSMYSQAQQEAAQLNDPLLDNNVCWWGSLDQFVTMVLPSCEHAIALDPYYGQYYDSRGVARALAGNRQGSIADFKFFVQWAKSQANTNLASSINERTAWIKKLEAGQNPFDSQTLKSLWIETRVTG